ncbi:transposable element Tcb2 transposase [Trichonephila clavipes]|nr:transposable element Tcb2 transposase [Trichonephila clavipes]
MSFTRIPSAGLPRQTSRLEDRHIVIYARVHPTASSAADQAHLTPSLGVPVSSRTSRRCLVEGHFGSRLPLRVVSLTTSHLRLCLELCLARGNWTAAGWNQVVFSDESRFNFSSDDNRVSVWRPRGERLNPTFVLQRHTTPTAVMMVCSVFGYNTRSPLALMSVTMTAQRLEKRKEKQKRNEGNRSKKDEGWLFSEDPGVLDRDADDDSWTRIRENALRTVPRQAVERATSKRDYHTG